MNILALPKPKIIDRFRIYLQRRWKEFLILAAFSLAVVLMSYTWLLQNVYYDRPGNYIKLAAARASNTKPSPLTGVKVLTALADRQVIGVMIENSPDARPQSSLSQAGVVFETVAEGGITRYLALYQESQPKEIGPVRSLRPYYLDWAMGYDSAFAHAGGSGDALGLVTERQAKSLNGLVYGQGFYRTGDRAAPHNLYTNMDKLDALAAELGYTSSKFEPYPRVRKEKPASAPTAPTINATYSSGSYSVQFRYNAELNSYLRFNAGAADIDRATGDQIISKNVVIIDMPASNDGRYAILSDIGSGKAVVLRDGIAITGIWKKDSPTSMLKLLDAEGKEILLNAGQTWFAVVPSDIGSYSY